MSNASQYVKVEMMAMREKVIPLPLIVVVSFSFVNTDLRDAFRTAFPDAHWILVDTDENLAKERIVQREGHFYNAESLSKSEVTGDSSNKTSDASVENSEWEFQYVDFPHTALDGRDTANANAKLILECIKGLVCGSQTQPST